MHNMKEMEKFFEVRGKMRKNLKVKVVLYVFWLLDTVSQVSNWLKFDTKDGDFRLSVFK